MNKEMEFTELFRFTTRDDAENGVITDSFFLNYEVIISLAVGIKLLSSVSAFSISVLVLSFLTLFIFAYGIKAIVNDSCLYERNGDDDDGDDENVDDDVDDGNDDGDENGEGGLREDDGQ